MSVNLQEVSVYWDEEGDEDQESDALPPRFKGVWKHLNQVPWYNIGNCVELVFGDGILLSDKVASNGP